jgi:hypothetical protein
VSLFNIVMLVVSGAASWWTFHLWRAGDPTWRLSIGAALMPFSAALIDTRLESVLLGICCIAISLYFLNSFKRYVPNKQ